MTMSKILSLGDFMVLNYIYGIIRIHVLPVRNFLSIDRKGTFPT